MSEHMQRAEPGVFIPDEQPPAGHPQPLGLAIVGMAQAGKTCLRGIVHNEWSGRFPESPVLDFSNSNGYRGLTLAALEHAGVRPDETVDEGDFLGELGDFMRTCRDLPAVLDTFYLTPRPDSELRAPSVNAVVATTSEIQEVRGRINAAGARFLGKVMLKPELAGLATAPGLVVIDGRNAAESHNKFQNAGVRSVGTLVMTCPEEDVARRLLDLNASEAAIAAEVARLQLRNTTDRQRATAPMTLPKDFMFALRLDELLADSDPAQSVCSAGTIMCHNPDVCITIPTDRVSIEDEARGMHHLFSGILLTADVTK